MSAPLSAIDVKFLQRMLCAAGCFSGKADGVWSQSVDDADVKLNAICDQIASTFGAFDTRSEQNIRTLHPRAQEAARKFLTALRAAGIDARIISGTRTYAEQDALFNIGRSGDQKKVVTNARGGESNHNFGIAWDVGIFAGGKYLKTEAPYVTAAAFCPPGIEWGGNWKSFRDVPHYQLATGKRLSEVRACFEQGTPFIA